MQLTTVGQEVWRGAKLAQRLDEVEASDPTVQERRRTKAIPRAFGERLVLKLVYAALI